MNNWYIYNLYYATYNITNIERGNVGKLSKLIGTIERVEDDTILVSFPSIQKNFLINANNYADIRQYFMPGIKITLDTDNSKIEIPIVEWMKENKQKLIEITNGGNKNV